MTSRKLPLLREVLMLPTIKVFPYLTSSINDVPERYDPTEGYLYYQNLKSPLLFCAHIDTIADRGSVKTFPIVESPYIWRGKGRQLGADDRAGVFALLRIRAHCIEVGLEVPNLLFTDGEESGGIGMWNFLTILNEFPHVRLAVAFDREGAAQYVTYNHLPNKVAEYIESFGFNAYTGTYSDICDFVTVTHIPGVNLSVGYHSAHSKQEELHLDELFMTIKRAIHIVAHPIDRLYKSKGDNQLRLVYPQSRYTYGQGWTTPARNDAYACDICGLRDGEYSYSGYWLCYNCYEDTALSTHEGYNGKHTGEYS